MATTLEEYMARKYAKKEKKIEVEQKPDIKEVKTSGDPDKLESPIVQESEPEKVSKSASIEAQTADVEDQPKVSESTSALQSNQEIAEEMKIKEQQMREELRQLKKLSKNTEKVHRDKLGNVITEEEAKMEKPDKRKREEEREENIAKRNKNEAGIEKERLMRERLKQIHTEGINMYENDAKVIKRQKEEIKEEDPALMFNKKIIDKHMKEVDKQFVSITGRKLYNDPTRYPSNRFNVKPGWRWDGIMRGNGFEQKWVDKNSN